MIALRIVSTFPGNRHFGATPRVPVVAVRTFARLADKSGVGQFSLQFSNLTWHNVIVSYAVL